MNEQKVRELFANIRHLVECGADFSNGNTHNGCDEGHVQGWQMWQKYMEEANELGLIDEALIAVNDPRVEQVIQVTEANNCLAFNCVEEKTEGRFFSNSYFQPIPATTYVLSFVDPGGSFILGDLTLLDEDCTSFCSGWLLFRDERFKQVRYIRHSKEAVVFTGTYTKEQLIQGLPEA